MRSHSSRGAIVLTIINRVALVGLLFSVGLLSCDTNQVPPQSTATPTSKALVRENALPGTSGWQIPQGKKSTTQIQAYASATSILPGQKLTFYVSTQREGTRYSVSI